MVENGGTKKRRKTKKPKLKTEVRFEIDKTMVMSGNCVIYRTKEMGRYIIDLKSNRAFDVETQEEDE